MAKKNLILVFIILIFSQNSLLAQTYTLKQAVETALNKSRLVKDVQFGVQAARARKKAAFFRAFPTISLQASYTRLSDEGALDMDINIPGMGAKTVELAPSIVNAWNLNLNIKQPLFTGLKIYNLNRLAKLDIKAEEEGLKLSRSNLVFNVEKAFFTVLKLEALKRVLVKTVEQLKAHRNTVQSLKNQGMLKESDILKIDVRIGSIEMKVLESDKSLKLAKQQLLLNMGLPVHMDITLDFDLEASKIALPAKLDNKTVEKHRTELKILEYRQKQSELKKLIAQAGWYPSLFLVGGFQYSNPNNRVFPPADKFEDSWNVSVVLDMNIWDWMQPKWKADEADAQRSKIKNNKELLKDKILFEYDAAMLGIKNSISKHKLAQLNIKSAADALKHAQNNLEQGMITTDDLLDSQIDLLRAKVELLTAAADFQVAKAALKKATGELIND